MFKTLFFTSVMIIFNQICEAGVQMRWLTGASVLLEDEETKILFDPAYTRPEWTHWLNIEEFRSDEDLVRGILQKNKIEKLGGIFSSHSHFDHVVDSPQVAKITGGVFYTDASSKIIAQAYKDPLIKTADVADGRKLQIGKFTITPIKREHSKIFHMFAFLPGAVTEDFEFGFYDYSVGETWFYLIEHPRGRILLDQAAETNMGPLKSLGIESVNVLIQGVSNRENNSIVLDGYVKLLKPQIYVPNHFDNFFTAFNDGEETLLPGVELEELLEEIKMSFPQVKLIVPKYGKSILLL